MGFFEKVLFGDGREWVCSQAHGEVLDVAVGTGRNFPFYPEGVRLTGIDLSPPMLEIARKKADELGLDADLREGDAQELPFPDASFDAVVCTLSLCTIPDDRRAVAEMKRVLRPRGRLLLLDHIRASSKVWLAVQRVLEPLYGSPHATTCCAGRWSTLWPRASRSSRGSATRLALSSASRLAGRGSGGRMCRRSVRQAAAASSR